jgi:hypothetical protein
MPANEPAVWRWWKAWCAKRTGALSLDSSTATDNRFPGFSDHATPETTFSAGTDAYPGLIISCNLAIHFKTLRNGILG